MVRFNAIIKRSSSQADKMGWTYVEIPAEVAAQLNPGSKKGFRIKGYLDKHKIERASVLPMGAGVFMLPLNKSVRRGINKPPGATITINITIDKRELEIDAELITCLRDEPAALKRFNSLTPSHQRYFSKWITDAKTRDTKINRIAKTINAMLNNLNFGETLKARE